MIIMSFNKHRNLFKGISNAVEATSKEEQIHGLFGIDVITIIKEEHPEWFDEAQVKEIRAMCIEAFQAESEIIDWIFADGELEYMSADVVKEFVKQRLNNSLTSIGVSSVFGINEKLVEETEWFDDEVIATKQVDFFDKRSINYNPGTGSMKKVHFFWNVAIYSQDKTQKKELESLLKPPSVYLAYQAMLISSTTMLPVALYRSLPLSGLILV